MMMIVETLEKVGIPPMLAPAEFPPPIITGSISICVFRCFYDASFRDALGDLHIGIFPRLRGRSFDGRLKMLEERNSMGGAGPHSVRATGPLLAYGPRS
jgi:hypothetical protein